MTTDTTTKGNAAENSGQRAGKAIQMDKVGRAKERLSSVLGTDDAEQVWQTCMAQANVTHLHSPQLLLRFGDAMVARGGYAAMFGRSLRVHAIVCGASIS